MLYHGKNWNTVADYFLFQRTVAVFFAISFFFRDDSAFARASPTLLAAQPASAYLCLVLGGFLRMVGNRHRSTTGQYRRRFR